MTTQPKLSLTEQQDSELSATMVTLLRQKRFDQNYGAMTMIMGYLPRLEQLRLQGLDIWWRDTGVGRVQWYFELPRISIYSDMKTRQITAVRENGMCQRLKFKEPEDLEEKPLHIEG